MGGRRDGREVFLPTQFVSAGLAVGWSTLFPIIHLRTSSLLRSVCSFHASVSQLLYSPATQGPSNLKISEVGWRESWCGKSGH